MELLPISAPVYVSSFEITMFRVVYFLQSHLLLSNYFALCYNSARASGPLLICMMLM